MANFQPVIDPKTQTATNLFFNNGSYYRYDPAKGYTPTTDTPQSMAQTGGVADQLTLKQDYNAPISGVNPQDYSGSFGQGYQNLGQSAGGHDAIVYNGILSLVNAFVDRVHAQSGKVPSEDQVKSFVANTVTPGFTQKIITGLGNDQLTAQYVDPYIQDNGAQLGMAAAGGNAQSRIMGLTDQLDKAYDAGKTKFINDTEENYGTQKQGLANDLAGQGMLTQPNSRYSLNALEANKNKAIAGGINTLAGQRAAGSVDLGKTIEDLLQKQQGITNQNSQFNKTFNAGREDNYFNQGLQNRQLSMADTLGRLQAEGNKKGPLDYLNTAINAAGTAAKVYSLV